MRFWRRNKVNKIVLTMVYSDFLLISAAGFLSPIVAVFLTQQIEGATIATVGFATTVFWVVKSALQVPISRAVDAKRGERDDFQYMIIGSVIASAVPLLYYFFAREVWHVFAFETLNGIGHALMVPTYLAIFTRHIDKHQESQEWTLHSNAVGLGYATAAALGGVLAERFGFRVVFLLVSAVMFLGTVVLLLIKDEIDNSDRAEGLAEEMAANQRKQLIR